MNSITCPFCGDDDFDKVGLKNHLTGEGLLFSEGCQAFRDTLSTEEESRLYNIERDYNAED